MVLPPAGKLQRNETDGTGRGRPGLGENAEEERGGRYRDTVNSVTAFSDREVLAPGEIETFMHELCEIAARETLPRFRTALAVDNKDSVSFDPVTVADHAAERAIRAQIALRYPHHGVVGEEAPPHLEDAEYCWVIDPIDGTRAFISGLPTWGTLIGLTHRGRPIAGTMHQPFTGERYVATEEGAFLIRDGSRKKLKSSDRGSLAEATMLTTSPFLFAPDRIEGYKAVEQRCRLIRYGFDCYGYAMVAAGYADIVIESGLKPFDIVALIPILQQAGAVVSDWHGDPADDGGDIVATANAELHEQVLAVLYSAGSIRAAPSQQADGGG
jgi:myo-inositol-1(or 4)-monophosphatase